MSSRPSRRSRSRSRRSRPPSGPADSLPTVPDLFSSEADDAFGGGAGFAEDTDEPGSQRPRVPLAVRMRPRTLDEVVGQQHLLGDGAPLRRLVEGSGGRAGPPSVVLWGPPGTGKTTLAHLVARAT